MVCTPRETLHVFAEPVGEVGGIDAGIGPAADAVGDGKGDVRLVADVAGEAGVLTAVGALERELGAGAGLPGGVEGGVVGRRVVVGVFGVEGGGEAVFETRDAGACGESSCVVELAPWTAARRWDLASRSWSKANCSAKAGCAPLLLPAGQSSLTRSTT